MLNLSTFQRQTIIDAIRALFTTWNNGVAANDFIESLWAEMPNEDLYVVLANFTKLTAKAI